MKIDIEDKAKQRFQIEDNGEQLNGREKNDSDNLNCYW